MLRARLIEALKDALKAQDRRRTSTVRLILAAVTVLAVAHPLLNAGARLTGKGPLIIIIDDGWAAAAHWPERRAMLGGFADQA